jgi:hypothetical protein
MTQHRTTAQAARAASFVLGDRRTSGESTTAARLRGRPARQTDDAMTRRTITRTTIRSVPVRTPGGVRRVPIRITTRVTVTRGNPGVVPIAQAPPG